MTAIRVLQGTGLGSALFERGLGLVINVQTSNSRASTAVSKEISIIDMLSRRENGIM